MKNTNTKIRNWFNLIIVTPDNSPDLPFSIFNFVIFITPRRVLYPRNNTLLYKLFIDDTKYLLMHTPERKHNHLIKSFNHNAANTQKPMSIKRDKRMIRTSVKQTTVSSGFRVADIQEAVGRSAGRRINLKTILNTRFDGVVPRELACAHEQAMPGNEHVERTMNHWERLCATRMKERKFHSFHGFWPWHGKIPWQPARMLPGNRRAYFKRQTETGMWCHPFGVIRCSSLVSDFSLLACHAIKPFFPAKAIRRVLLLGQTARSEIIAPLG